MNNTVFFRIIGVGIFAAMVFALYPQLDIALSKPFYTRGFAMSVSPFANILRKTGMILPFIAAGVAIYWLIRRQHLKIAYFWLSSLIIAPILIVNVILKDYWHRARPVQIVEFGGNFTFTPWYLPGNALECVKNCSFVSGEVSGVFCLLVVAAVTPALYQRLVYSLTLIFAVLISFLRLSFGGHFMSDLFISAIITYSVIKLMHYLIFERNQTP
jgi:membrane-associated phospholipid phosphatase